MMIVNSARAIFPFLVLLVLVTSSACSGGQEVAQGPTVSPSAAASTATPLPTAAPTAVPTSTPTQTPLPTDTPLPTATTVPTLTPTSTPAALDAVALYEQISPAIFQVFSPFFSGSGFLIEGDYVLTAAHVVYPNEYVLVALPGGREEYVPVYSVDLMVDLALLGPIDQPGREPLPLAFDKHLQPGDQVAVIGFDQTTETTFMNLEAEIKEGTVVERLAWPGLGVEFYQTDIDPIPGNSGSPLLDAQGQVVGIINIGHGAPPALLVPAMADLEPRIRAALAGEGQNTLSMGRLDYEAAPETEFPFMISDSASGLVVVLPETASEPWELTLRQANADMIIFDSFGDFVATTWDEGTKKVMVEETEYAPYFVQTFGDAFGLADVLESSLPLIRFKDPDDEREVHMGDMVYGALDYPQDTDNFNLKLEAGQEVFLTLESFMIDPVVSISSEGDSLLFAMDDDGGGLRGLDAALTYRAPESGYYTIGVGSGLLYESGGYLLHIAEPDEQAPEPTVIDGEEYELMIQTAVGDMDQFTTADGRLRVLFPYSMSKALLSFPEFGFYCNPPDATCFIDDRALLSVAQQPLYRPISGVPSLEEWSAELWSAFDADQALQIDERGWMESDVGTLPYLELTFQPIDSDPVHLYQVLAILGDTGTTITYLALEEEVHPELQAQIAYTFEHLQLLKEE